LTCIATPIYLYKESYRISAPSGQVSMFSTTPFPSVLSLPLWAAREKESNLSGCINHLSQEERERGCNVRLLLLYAVVPAPGWSKCTHLAEASYDRPEKERKKGVQCSAVLSKGNAQFFSVLWWGR
jgi:hypothetical protein